MAALGLWIDVARILAQSDCWIRCMKLHPANQSEIACKLRYVRVYVYWVAGVYWVSPTHTPPLSCVGSSSAADGMAAISELDPGLLTGPLSEVWGSLIRDLVDTFGLGPNELVIAPYDWRLPPSKLQERDKYFTSLKRKSACGAAGLWACRLVACRLLTTNRMNAHGCRQSSRRSSSTATRAASS